MQGCWVPHPLLENGMALPERIDKHLQQLAPHVATRESAVLLQDARDELVFLRTGISQCYKMLISEPNTQGALFKAENILRDLMTSHHEAPPK